MADSPVVRKGKFNQEAHMQHGGVVVGYLNWYPTEGFQIEYPQLF